MPVKIKFYRQNKSGIYSAGKFFTGRIKHVLSFMSQNSQPPIPSEYLCESLLLYPLLCSPSQNSIGHPMMDESLTELQAG